MKKNILKKCIACRNTQHELFTESKDRLYNFPGKWKIYKCTKCGLLSLNPAPKNLSKYYPNNYMVYQNFSEYTVQNYKKLALKNHFGYTHLKTKNNILEIIKSELYYFASIFNNSRIIPFKKGLLLDVGCGNGEFLATQKQLGWKTIGIDFNNIACKVGKKHNLKIICGDYESKKMNQKFSTITASFVLEHTKKPDKFIKKANSALETGGQIILDVPNSNALDMLILKNKSYSLDSPRHQFIFNKKNLSKLLEDNGFEVIKITHPPANGHFIKSINNFLTSKGIKYSFAPENKFFLFITYPLSFFELSPEIRVFAKKINNVN